MNTQASNIEIFKPGQVLDTEMRRHSTIEKFYHESQHVDILALGTHTRELAQNIATILPFLSNLDSVAYRTHRGGHCRMIFRGLFYDGSYRVSVLLNSDFKRERASMSDVAEDPFAFFGIKEEPANDVERFITMLGGCLNRTGYGVYGGKRDDRSVTVFYRQTTAANASKRLFDSAQDVAITLVHADPMLRLLM